MNLRPALVAALMVLCLVGTPSQCQSANPQDIAQLLEWYKGRAEYLIGEFRPQIRSGLSPEDRAVEESVHYRVVANTGNANGQAKRINGVNYTYIGAELIQVIDWLATSLAIDTAFGQRACTIAYISYLADGINGNTAAVISGHPLQVVGSPFVFAQLRPDLCSDMTEMRFRARQRAVDMREMYVGGSIRLLMTHELGHHVHHDTWLNAASIRDKRDREKAADDFAFRTLALSGTIPIEGLPLILLFSSVEGFSVEGETASDHPAGVRRLRDMFEVSENAVDSDEAVRAALLKSGKMAQWKQMVALLKQQVDQVDQK